MNFLKLFLFFYIFCFFISCSYLKKRNNAEKYLVINKLWLKNTVSKKDYFHFTKNNRMKPIESGSLIIQANGINRIVAYDKFFGNEVWSIPIANGVEASVFLGPEKDKIYIGACDGNFYILEAASGKKIWNFSVKEEILSRPLIYANVAYFITGNNVLFAIDLIAKKEKWLYSRQDLSEFSIRGSSSPAIKDNNLIVGFSDGYLVNLNALTGEVIWEVSLNKNKRFRDIDSSAVFDGKYFYISGYDDYLYCINIEDGSIKWKLNYGGYNSVTLFEDRIYYATSQNKILVLDKDNGKIIWEKETKGIATKPIIFKRMLIYGESRGALKFVDLNDGKDIAYFTPGKGILAPIYLNKEENKIYFISNQAILYALKFNWQSKKNDSFF